MLPFAPKGAASMQLNYASSHNIQAPAFVALADFRWQQKEYNLTLITVSRPGNETMCGNTPTNFESTWIDVGGGW